MSDFYQVSRADLEAINKAMNHMGDVLNGMDAVEEEDEVATEAGFKAIQAILASHPSNAVQDAPAAWIHEEDSNRVISAAQKEQALRDGGASASSVKPYSIAAVVPVATVPPVVQAPEEERELRGMLTGGKPGPLAWVRLQYPDQPTTNKAVAEAWVESGWNVIALDVAPQPIAASPSIVPSDEQIGELASEHLCIDFDRVPHGIYTFARALLTTTSNAGEAAPAAIDVRDAALEEAATICDKSSLQPAIAARIRALKSPPQTGKEQS